MKRYLLITLLLVAILTLGAAPNQVTIKLTTSVPEVLVHGFLKDGDTTTIYAEEDKDNAFDPDGVEFTYAVKTNTSIRMTVYATVTPFYRQDPENPAEVNIAQVRVKDEGGDESTVENTGDEYELVTFTPNKGGMAVYAYTLTVIANADEVANAPAGDYKSTVSIGITTGN